MERFHVDFRGDGGYIITPPSRVVVSGVLRGYQVIARGARPYPIDGGEVRRRLTPPTPAPSRLDRLDTPAGRGVSAERIAAWLAGAEEGNRNGGLFWAACRLAELGMSEAGTVQALEPAATRTGLGVEEIHRTIRSAHSRHANTATASLRPTPAPGRWDDERPHR